MRSLVAWIDNRQVGIFSEMPQPDGSTRFAFEYQALTEWDIVSLTLVPLPDVLRFEMPTFPSPFDMILPEGERRLQIEAARKILRADSFSLLSYVGGNPVNRVRFLPLGESPGKEPPELPTPAEIAGSTRGRELFKELVGALDLRQGIAGVQPKVLGAPRNIQKLSPHMRQFRGSTHILKSSDARYPFLAANEHACLEVFKAAGLPVPNVTLSADGELLLVERFDIRADGTCMGFEEAAALMGETSLTKYQQDYGTLFGALSQFLDAKAVVRARCDLMKALFLNHLLGNGDAHLKNFGVLYEHVADVNLAPFYDCVSTLPYISNDVPALALSFEWYSKAWWPRIKLEEFADQYANLTQAETLQMIKETTGAVMEGVERMARQGREIAGFGDLGRRIAALWEERVKSFLAEDSGLKPKRAAKRREGA